MGYSARVPFQLNFTCLAIFKHVLDIYECHNVVGLDVF